MSSLQTISSLSNQLKISTSWLYKQVEKRQIPFHKIGTSIRFTEEDISEILKKYEEKPLIPKSEGVLNGN